MTPCQAPRLAQWFSLGLLFRPSVGRAGLRGRREQIRRSVPRRRKWARCRRYRRRRSYPVFFVGNFALALCPRGVFRRCVIGNISRMRIGPPPRRAGAGRVTIQTWIRAIRFPRRQPPTRCPS